MPGGAADLEGHLCVGDEITWVDGLNVEGASHRKVVQLMGQASTAGHVALRVRRRRGGRGLQHPPTGGAGAGYSGL